MNSGLLRLTLAMTGYVHVIHTSDKHCLTWQFCVCIRRTDTLRTISGTSERKTQTEREMEKEKDKERKSRKKSQICLDTITKFYFYEKLCIFFSLSVVHHRMTNIFDVQRFE